MPLIASARTVLRSPPVPEHSSHYRVRRPRMWSTIKRRRTDLLLAAQHSSRNITRPAEQGDEHDPPSPLSQSGDARRSGTRAEFCKSSMPGAFVVLPVRIELTTSPLPREG